jgi:hypothetical protein
VEFTAAFALAAAAGGGEGEGADGEGPWAETGHAGWLKRVYKRFQNPFSRRLRAAERRL